MFSAGDWRCVSGQIGLTDEGLSEDFATQAGAALANLLAVLSDNGLSSDQVAKTTVFLADMADYDTLNTVYIEFFGDHRPARSAVAVSGLPLDASVEIEAWVYVGA